MARIDVRLAQGAASQPHSRVNSCARPFFWHTKVSRILPLFLLLLGTAAQPSYGQGPLRDDTFAPAVQSPILKWQHGGCANWGCETGWYSSPAVADLESDGHGEVVFASWVQKGSNRTGKLHILDYLGYVLQEVDLPPAFGGDWNGALAAPTLADIDGDPDLEVVLNTAHSGLVAYDLPGTAGARVLWGTGRGSYWRNGSVPSGSTLTASSIGVSPPQSAPGGRLDYALFLRNPGRILSGVRVLNPLPPETAALAYLWASAGKYGAAGEVITWTGSVATDIPVTITFGITLSSSLPTPHTVIDRAWIDDGQGNFFPRWAVALVGGGYTIYLPLVSR